jgi:hypothetical protein
MMKGKQMFKVNDLVRIVEIPGSEISGESGTIAGLGFENDGYPVWIVALDHVLSNDAWAVLVPEGHLVHNDGEEFDSAE